MNQNRFGNQKTIWDGLRKIAAMFFVAAVLAMATPVQAATTLKITDNNLDILKNKASWTPYNYGELMLWPSSLDVKEQKLLMVGTIKGTTVADNAGRLWTYGECVSFVKALSKSDVATGSWIKGDNVLSTYNMIAPGTVIATFGGNNGGYGGHTAVFRDYLYDSAGKKIGILVWDQNYLPDHGGAVARHNIKTTGSSISSQADKYYVVKI